MIDQAFKGPRTIWRREHPGCRGYRLAAYSLFRWEFSDGCRGASGRTPWTAWWRWRKWRNIVIG